ncbi:hypothetical protein CEUSTIGMA_g13017.t1 [Chlamydomonas eustigma]|uniref:Cytochrome b5 heme-binding domain-containing protein n=1 Tax=Chlamydomonas eustigma TaxID=1157962 RepID=A0A250XRP4_9CHLO|nr:hypothetical protein CEUSTIGMA_g13017.t1 [Chlamydomonas eustigma]|eukprot:GAX85602.1 hypothetical protein CEUSTIGMA_g13017.t1 [Chlamydomonas eustigma]
MQSRILACLKRPLFDQPSVGFTAYRAIGLYGTSSKFEGEQAFFSQNKGAVFAALSVVGALSSYAICCQPVNAKQLQGAVPEMKSPADATSCPSPATSRLLNADDSGLPTFTVEEVAEHRDLKSGIWITYKGEVYDITEFIEAHPGGVAKIMLAAGGSIEPFWAMYKQHNKDEVRSILAQYKVGKLAGGEAASAGKALEDPFKNEPPRHPALITRSAKPCNAETPGSLLAAQIITPTDLFYVRNHLPVPEVDASAWKLKIKGEGLRTIELTMEELQTKFKKHVISTTIQCAGNRRSEMKEIKPVKGLDWNIGAIGTATFGGVLLRDVLEYAGLQENEPGVNHIHFVGLDSDPLSGEVYAASVPAHKVLSKTEYMMTVCMMTVRMMTVYMMTVHMMTVCMMTVCMMTVHMMTVCMMTVRMMTVCTG